MGCRRVRWCSSGCGHMEILEWLRSEGCPCEEMACMGAGASGHLEMLKWLRSEGCPWDGNTWLNAAESTREWLKENGCPQHYDESDEYSDDDYSDDVYSDDDYSDE